MDPDKEKSKTRKSKTPPKTISVLRNTVPLWKPQEDDEAAEKGTDYTVPLSVIFLISYGVFIGWIYLTFVRREKYGSFAKPDGCETSAMVDCRWRM